MNARARNTDPTTSHAAAASVRDVTRRQYAVLEVFAIHGPLADPELSEYYATLQQFRPDGYPLQTDSGLRTRRHELVRAGLVEDAGTRRITNTGRQAIVWRITRAGRERVLEGL